MRTIVNHADGNIYHCFGVYVCLSLSRLDFEEEEEGGGRRASLAPSLPQEAPELVTMPSRFEQVQQKGTIDVWWIYDDGGK